MQVLSFFFCSVKWISFQTESRRQTQQLSFQSEASFWLNFVTYLKLTSWISPDQSWCYPQKRYGPVRETWGTWLCMGVGRIMVYFTSLSFFKRPLLIHRFTILHILFLLWCWISLIRFTRCGEDAGMLSESTIQTEPSCEEGWGWEEKTIRWWLNRWKRREIWTFQDFLFCYVVQCVCQLADEPVFEVNSVEVLEELNPGIRQDCSSTEHTARLIAQRAVVEIVRHGVVLREHFWESGRSFGVYGVLQISDRRLHKIIAPTSLNSQYW